MTRDGWLACQNPETLLNHTKYLAWFDLRLQRLAACGIVRALAEAINATLPEECREQLTVAERYADGLVSHRKLREAHNAIWGFYQHYMDLSPPAFRYGSQRRPALTPGQVSLTWMVAWCCALWPAEQHMLGHVAGSQAGDDLGGAVCDTLREVIGNPYESLEASPYHVKHRTIRDTPRPLAHADVMAWNASTVPRFAERIYRDGCWSDMPIFADALEEAGVTDEVVLWHCRNPAERHRRGCWVLEWFREVPDGDGAVEVSAVRTV